MEPSAPEDYSPSFPSQLPKELQALLSQHPGWGLSNPPDRDEPPFFGPLDKMPEAKHLEQLTDVKHAITIKLLNAQNPDELVELQRILQECMDGVHNLICEQRRWDDKGLFVFIVYDTLTKRLKDRRQTVQPTLSPR